MIRSVRPLCAPAAAGLGVLLWTLLASVGCHGEQGRLPVFAVTVAVVDEAGQPVPGADIAFEDRSARTDATGTCRLERLLGPAMMIVRADGYLPEPLPIGWEDEDKTVTLTLLSRQGGRRFAMHFGGDAMFGRRYESPSEGFPLIPQDSAASGAQEVVSRMAPVFAMADFRSANLETVLSTRDYGKAYPGKRFLLRSHPDTVAALQAMGLDMVIFANNHARDFLDVGVGDTLQALAVIDLPQVGGGLTAAEAEAPLTIQVGDIKVGTLAYTTVTGSFVNDNYPSEDAPVPADLSQKDAWLYELRPFGGEATPLFDLAGMRRIGALWEAYADREGDMSELDRAITWGAMAEVFPELQDWVARRGHGGSAQFKHSSSPGQIAALAARSDVVVVQLHAGYQFQEAASESVRDAARAAIDAGADVVVAHHPHVLQGFEWYRGKLIAYSLGNFVFDQDFLSTFASGFLRLVWDGESLLQARFVPLEIIGYRPTPVTDRAARRTLKTVWERSLVKAAAVRHPQTGDVLPMERGADDGQSKAVEMRFEHHTARLVATPEVHMSTLRVPAQGVARLPDDVLTEGTLGLPAGDLAAIDVGRDLFGWGHFEDAMADGQIDLTGHWALGHKDKKITLADDAVGHGLLRLQRDERNSSTISMRPVARIPLSRHRLWRDDGAAPTPLDPKATYSLEFLARKTGDVTPELRVDIYHFDDTNPTEDPESELLLSKVIPIEGVSDALSPVHIGIDPGALTGSDAANMFMFYLSLPAPARGEATLDVDELAVVEWRAAAAMPQDAFGAYTHVRNRDDAAKTLNFRVRSSTESR